MISVLKKKLNKKKGFTLAELLVVVAIIAILVAIAIPMFKAATDKAYLGVAQANARSAYGEWMVEYISAADDTEKPKQNDTITYETGGKTTTCTLTSINEDATTGEVTMQIKAAIDGTEETYTFKSGH